MTEEDTDLSQNEISDAFSEVVCVLDAACNVGATSAKQADGGMEISMFLDAARARDWVRNWAHRCDLRNRVIDAFTDATGGGDADEWYFRLERQLTARGLAIVPAQGIAARSDETLQAAQPEGQEPGGEAMRPDSPA